MASDPIRKASFLLLYFNGKGGNVIQVQQYYARGSFCVIQLAFIGRGKMNQWKNYWNGNHIFNRIWIGKMTIQDDFTSITIMMDSSIPWGWFSVFAGWKASCLSCKTMIDFWVVHTVVEIWIYWLLVWNTFQTRLSPSQPFPPNPEPQEHPVRH